MPTQSEYLAQMRSSDAALLFICTIIALCVVATIYLWRRIAWFRRASKLTVLTLIPVTSLFVAGLAHWELPANALFSSANASGYLFKTFKIKHECALLLILLLAIVLRIPRMFDSMWFDEAFTARVASLQLEQLPGAIALDTHPPLHYSLIWVWSHIVGNHDWALRIPDLVFGVIAVYLMYRLAKLTMRAMHKLQASGFGDDEQWAAARNVGLVAALLMAVLPGAIYYSNELRPYSMLTVFVFSALICLFEFRPRALAFMLVGIVLSHNLGWFYFGVIAGAALLLYRRRIIGYIGTDGLISAPFLLLAYHQSQRLTNGFWITFNPGQPLRALIMPIGAVPEGWIAPIVLPWLALLMLSLWIARKWIKQPGGIIVMAVALGVPSLVIFTSAIWTPLFIPRPMLPCLLLLLIPLAYALVVAPSRRLVRAVITPVLLLALVSFYSPYAARADYQTAIASGCDGADVMYATEIATGFIVAPYWDDELLMWHGAEDNGQTFTIDDMQAFNFRIGDVDQLSGHRVCVMFIDSPYAPDAERAYIDELRAEYPYTQTYHQPVNPIQDIMVYVFDL